MIDAAVEQQLVEWAASRDDVRVVLVVGSRARKEAHPADGFSDLDVVMYTTDPALYLSSDALPLFTRSALHIRCETWPNGSLDKDGLAAKLAPPDTVKPFVALPTQASFTDTVGEFFYDALATAKQIRRGNLWVAQSLDKKCKRHLLTMLEWKTLLEKPGVDVWHDGRFMHEWLDAKTWSAIPGIFGALEAESMLHALKNMITIFRQAAQTVAEILHFVYPPVDAAVSAVIERM